MAPNPPTQGLGEDHGPGGGPLHQGPPTESRTPSSSTRRYAPREPGAKHMGSPETPRPDGQDDRRPSTRAASAQRDAVLTLAVNSPGGQDRVRGGTSFQKKKTGRGRAQGPPPECSRLPQLTASRQFGVGPRPQDRTDRQCYWNTCEGPGPLEVRLHRVWHHFYGPSPAERPTLLCRYFTSKARVRRLHRDPLARLPYTKLPQALILSKEFASR